MLEELIQNDWVLAVKAKDSFRVNTISAIKDSILTAKKEPGFNGVLSDSEIEKIMQKMCKVREEDGNTFKENGRPELAEKEFKELEIISAYLPKQATEQEVEAVVGSIIGEIGANSMKDMGKVIKIASTELGSRSNGKTISEITKRLLNNNK